MCAMRVLKIISLTFVNSNEVANRVVLYVRAEAEHCVFFQKYKYFLSRLVFILSSIMHRNFKLYPSYTR